VKYRELWRHEKQKGFAIRVHPSHRVYVNDELDTLYVSPKGKIAALNTCPTLTYRAYSHLTQKSMPTRMCDIIFDRLTKPFAVYIPLQLEKTDPDLLEEEINVAKSRIMQEYVTLVHDEDKENFLNALILAQAKRATRAFLRSDRRSIKDLKIEKELTTLDWKDKIISLARRWYQNDLKGYYRFLKSYAINNLAISIFDRNRDKLTPRETRGCKFIYSVQLHTRMDSKGKKTISCSSQSYPEILGHILGSPIGNVVMIEFGLNDDWFKNVYKRNLHIYKDHFITTVTESHYNYHLARGTEPTVFNLYSILPLSDLEIPIDKKT